MQTLNQHISIFRNFAESHKQINSFGVGELWELTEKNGDRVYSIMWMVLDPDNIAGNELIDNYTFVFADIVRPDESNENEVLSDEKQKALDLISFLRFSDAINSATNVIKAATLTPFTEKFEDNLAGWILTVQVKQAFIYNYCDAPVSGISPAPPLCAPVTITDGGDTVEVDAGGSYTCVNGGGCESIDIRNTDDSFTLTITCAESPKTLSDIIITIKNSEGTTIGSDTVPSSKNVDVSVIDTPIKNSAGTLQANIPSGVDYTIPNDTVTNTDASVTFNNIIQGVPKVLPDVTMTQPNGGTTTHPSMKNFSCTQISALATQDLNNQLTPSQINQVQRQQPTRTGQTTLYRAGDDGDLELGIGASFSTLSDNNIFGNTNRFTDETGAQTYTNDFILDHLTGLMWYRVPTSANWNTAIDNCNAYAGGGFTDWFLPNINQLTTIHNYSNSMVTNYSPFNINVTAAASRLWTSTTNPATTTNAFQNVENNGIAQVVKTNVSSYIPCRKFIPSDFGL